MSLISNLYHTLENKKKNKKLHSVKKAKKEVEAFQEDEEAEVEDKTKPKIVIEHCKQCNAFKTRAIQVKEGLEGAVPGVTVALNPEKGYSFTPRRGCFEIREEGGETFISLLVMLSDLLQ
ncbi:BnaC03g67660D [Brassica napus]|uniref:BnaC03g67660D protein n=1 Tax=Brassica napus TaxID=3708 RepID=A0A078HF80_BRANA|nr:BnaC03g67660D [Brassica napus]